MKKTFVISLGGSLINPGEIDTAFLKRFKKLIEAQTKKGNKFILIVGGGKPARQYPQALRAVTSASADQLDWMGIYATRFNAQLVRLLFGKLAHPAIIEDPSKKIPFTAKIIIGAGWKPGWSTDYDAVLLAKNYGAKTVINLSNIDYVYTRDPKKYADAKKIESISWREFKKIVGSKWKPGANLPFDPIATKLAEQNNLRVIIANGKNLENLKNILEEKQFIGTEIK